jgi:methionyl-tRNA synthetase
MEDLSFQKALLTVWELVSELNRYVDHQAPWSLYKAQRHGELREVLYNCLEALRFLCLMIYPFMPSSAEKLWSMLGFKNQLKEVKLDREGTWGKTPENQQIGEIYPLFPRVEG